MKPKFVLGQLLSTSGVVGSIDLADVQAAVQRHAAGDWGDLSEEDRQSNEIALAEREQLFSVYRDRKGTKFYVITESNRKTTTVLLPEEY